MSFIDYECSDGTRLAAAFILYRFFSYQLRKRRGQHFPACRIHIAKLYHCYGFVVEDSGQICAAGFRNYFSEIMKNASSSW